MRFGLPPAGLANGLPPYATDDGSGSSLLSLANGLCCDGSQREGADTFHYLTLFGFRQVVLKGKTQQPIADRLGNRALTRPSAELHAHLGKMQRQVMEDAQDAAALQVID